MQIYVTKLLYTWTHPTRSLQKDSRGTCPLGHHCLGRSNPLPQRAFKVSNLRTKRTVQRRTCSRSLTRPRLCCPRRRESSAAVADLCCLMMSTILSRLSSTSRPMYSITTSPLEKVLSLKGKFSLGNISHALYKSRGEMSADRVTCVAVEL